MNTTWLSKAATGCAEGACLNVLVTIDPKSSFKCALSMSMTLLDFISPRINNLQAPNHPINIRIHQSQAPRHATWRERRTNRHAMSRCMIIHANQSYVEPCRLSVRRRQSFAFWKTENFFIDFLICPRIRVALAHSAALQAQVSYWIAVVCCKPLWLRLLQQRSMPSEQLVS
jgi:hypothetical protein